MVPTKPDVREPMRINRTITVRGASTRLQYAAGMCPGLSRGRNYKICALFRQNDSRRKPSWLAVMALTSPCTSWYLRTPKVMWGRRRNRIFGYIALRAELVHRTLTAG
jgi:hypothetical protein